MMIRSKRSCARTVGILVGCAWLCAGGCSEGSTGPNVLGPDAGAAARGPGDGGTSTPDAGSAGGGGSSSQSPGDAAPGPSGSGDAPSSDESTGAGSSADAGTHPGNGRTPSGDAATEPATQHTRVDNPYANATGYVNPLWRAKAESEPGGERIADTPTAVWLDRIAAIEDTGDGSGARAMGLGDHLDAALEQGAGYIQIVIYNLPGRDCAALASNGELAPDELPRYKSEYIDPIAAIMDDPKYRELRIITIIEPDSLPNLITNTDIEKCARMKENGGYVNGIVYALETLGAIPNVYNYIDAGHHGWLGWESNLGPAAELWRDTAQMAGMDNVHGFVTNTANYSALDEPHFDADTTVGGQSVRMSSWVDWNQYVDELAYAKGLRDELISLGFDSSLGMLIDTSRNGWGGSERPTSPSSSTDVETFVEESRVDRRIHTGNWCNQAGAGLGRRPTANPEPGIDAYAWIKPPGESDGASRPIENDQGKGFDRMCDPDYGGNELNGNNPTGALSGAPLAGAWFSKQFQQLMENAHPPL